MSIATEAAPNGAGPSDLPTGLTFVDPGEIDNRYRVVLWAAPGEGKSVAAATAPTPIVVLSADRPGAYRFARRHLKLSAGDLRETRYVNHNTLSEVYRYLRENPDVRTVVIDPFHNVYDKLVDAAPRRGDGEPDYQAVNRKLLGFLYSLRDFDVNVVLVAHEKLNDGKKGDGKMYPQLGGPTLTNKVLAESDIVARVEREPGDGDEPARYVAQLTPRANLVCKESTGALGERRALNLTEWFEVASLAGVPDETDLPWAGDTFDQEPAS